MENNDKVVLYSLTEETESQKAKRVEFDPKFKNCCKKASEKEEGQDLPVNTSTKVLEIIKKFYEEDFEYNFPKNLFEMKVDLEKEQLEATLGEKACILFKQLHGLDNADLCKEVFEAVEILELKEMEHYFFLMYAHGLKYLPSEEDLKKFAEKNGYEWEGSDVCDQGEEYKEVNEMLYNFHVQEIKKDYDKKNNQ